MNKQSIRIEDESEHLMRSVLRSYRKRNEKSADYRLTLVQLMTDEERKEAAKKSREAWL